MPLLQKGCRECQTSAQDGENEKKVVKATQKEEVKWAKHENAKKENAQDLKNHAYCGGALLAAAAIPPAVPRLVDA